MLAPLIVSALDEVLLHNTAISCCTRADAPAAAAYSTLHPADATAEVPWAWPAEALFSADTDAGDVLFVPDGWSASNMFNVEAVTLAAEVETGVGEFSVALK